MRNPGTIALMAALFVLTGNADAHHSRSMFADTPVWVSGTIVRYRPVDPHVMIELEEKQADGRVRRWIVEGPNMGRLARIMQDHRGVAARDLLRTGDTISVCGFPVMRDFPPGGGYP